MGVDRLFGARSRSLMGTRSLSQSNRCSAWARRCTCDSLVARPCFNQLKEYMEYAPGILRAFVKPAQFDVLCFTLRPVPERKMGVTCYVRRGHEARWAQEACRNQTDVQLGHRHSCLRLSRYQAMFRFQCPLLEEALPCRGCGHQGIHGVRSRNPLCMCEVCSL